MRADAYIDLEITENASQNFINSVVAQKDRTELYVWINSLGGYTGEAKAIVNFLQEEKNRGINVITHAQAYCDSSAILIFLAGNTRKIDKFNESFLVHRVSSGVSGNYEQIEEVAKQTKETELSLAKLYNYLGGIEETTALNLMRAEQSLTPEQTLKYGFATEIVSLENAKNKKLDKEKISKIRNKCKTDACVLELQKWATNLKTNMNKTKKVVFDYNAINRKANARDIRNAFLNKTTSTKHLAKLAKNMVEEYAEDAGEMPENMVVSLEDGTQLYIYSETEDIVDKRVVLADADGNPTEEPAPDGMHMLESGKEVRVSDGLILEVIEPEPENMKDDKEKKDPENIKKTDPENMEGKDKEKASNLNAKVLEKLERLEKLEKEIDDLKKTSSTHKPTNASGNAGGSEKEFKKHPVQILRASNLSERTRKFLVSAHAEKIRNHGIENLNVTSEVKESLRLAQNANDIIITDNNYAGEIGKDLVAEALLKGDGADDFTIHENVKDEITLTKINTKTTFQDPSATWTPSGNDIDLEYNPKIVVADYEVHAQISTQKLKDAWHNSELGRGALGDYESSVMINWWINQVVDQIAIGNDIMRYRGKSGIDQLSLEGEYDVLGQKLNQNFSDSYLGYIPTLQANSLTKRVDLSGDVATFKSATGITVSASNGDVTQITLSNVTNLSIGDMLTFEGFDGADASLINGNSAQIVGISGSVVDVELNTFGLTITATGTPIVKFINETNVIQVLKEMYRRIPQRIKKSGDAVIYVSPDLTDFYEYATSSGAQSGSIDYYLNAIPKSFLSNKMEVRNYLGANTILVDRKENMHFATDLLSDESNVNYTYEGGTTNNMLHKLRVGMKGNVGVRYARESTLVF